KHVTSPPCSPDSGSPASPWACFPLLLSSAASCWFEPQAPHCEVFTPHQCPGSHMALTSGRVRRCAACRPGLWRGGEAGECRLAAAPAGSGRQFGQVLPCGCWRRCRLSGLLVGGLAFDEGGDPIVQFIDPVEAAVAAGDDGDLRVRHEAPPG